jgi:hypothetical protein
MKCFQFNDLKDTIINGIRELYIRYQEHSRRKRNKSIKSYVFRWSQKSLDPNMKPMAIEIKREKSTAKTSQRMKPEISQSPSHFISYLLPQIRQHPSS